VKEKYQKNLLEYSNGVFVQDTHMTSNHPIDLSRTKSTHIHTHTHTHTHTLSLSCRFSQIWHKKRKTSD